MRKLITALGIFIALTVLSTSPVWACHVIVSGQADCQEGVRSVSWRIENSEVEPATFSYKVHRVTTGVVAENTGVVLPGDHGFALVSVSVTAGEYWIEIDALWATRPTKDTFHVGQGDQAAVVATKDCQSVPVTTTRPPATTAPPTTQRPPTTSQPPTTVPPVVTTSPPPPTTAVPPVVTTTPPVVRPLPPVTTLPVTGKNTVPMLILVGAFLTIGYSLRRLAAMVPPVR